MGVTTHEESTPAQNRFCKLSVDLCFNSISKVLARQHILIQRLGLPIESLERVVPLTLPSSYFHDYRLPIGSVHKQAHCRLRLLHFWEIDCQPGTWCVAQRDSIPSPPVVDLYHRFDRAVNFTARQFQQDVTDEWFWIVDLPQWSAGIEKCMGGSWSWLWNFIRRNEENAPQGFIGDVNQPSDSSTVSDL